MPIGILIVGTSSGYLFELPTGVFPVLPGGMAVDPINHAFQMATAGWVLYPKH